LAPPRSILIYFISTLARENPSIAGSPGTATGTGRGTGAVVDGKRVADSNMIYFLENEKN